MTFAARLALSDGLFVAVAAGVWVWALRSSRRRAAAGHRSFDVALPYAVAVAGLVLASVLVAFTAPGFPLFPAIRYGAETLLVGVPALATAAAFTLRRGWRAAALAVALVGFAAALEGYVLCPRRLEVVTTRIPAPRGLRPSRPIRIALVSDIQTDHVGDYEAHALEAATTPCPDLLVLAGDFIQVPGREEFREQAARLRPLLANAAARCGNAVAVWGNVDVPVPLGELFAGTPIPLLVNESRDFTFAGVPVRVTGLAMRTSFRMKPETLRPFLPAAPPGAIHVAVGHAPDFAAGAAELGTVDVALAGHTHGGQVVIPGIGPLMTFSYLPKNLASGTHTLGPLTLVVTKGVGMERLWAPRVRLFCPPDVTIVEIG